MIKRKVQVLVATMNQMSHRELLSSMNITGSAVVINQVTDSRKKLRDLEHRKSGVIFASFFEKGLSRSRNRALAASSADICVVADDDLRYIDGYEDVIRSGYTKYPDADIIAFEVDYSNEKKNKKSLKEGRVGLLYSMKISSVRISFRRESVIDAGVQFDENFGAGTDNFMGE